MKALPIAFTLASLTVANGGIILQVDANDLGLTDGAPVASWGPLSQSTSANQPTYRAGGLNGNPSVDFDGTDDFLSGGTLSGARAVVAVTIYEGTINLAGLISNDNDRFNIRRNGLNNFYRSAGQAGDNNDFYRHGNHAGQDNVYVDGTGSGAFVSGTSHIVLANAGADADFTNFTVGRAAASGGASGRWWDGDVSEIIAFDQTLTNDEIIGITSVLADKWGSTPVAATPAQISAAYALGVPEPSSSLLALLGAGFLIRRRRH